MINKRDCVPGAKVKYDHIDTGGDKEGQPLWGGKYGKIPGRIKKVDYSLSVQYGVFVEFENGKICNFNRESLSLLEGQSMTLLRIKSRANRLVSTTKNYTKRYLVPYRKYIGIVVLLLVVDYFIFEGKHISKAKDQAGKLVDRILRRTQDVIEQ
jgi:hypothetical protein